MSSKKRLIPSQQISNFLNFNQRVDVSQTTPQTYSGYSGTNITRYLNLVNANEGYVVSLENR